MRQGYLSRAFYIHIHVLHIVVLHEDDHLIYGSAIISKNSA